MTARPSHRLSTLTPLVCALLAGCGPGDGGAGPALEMPRSDSQDLMAGRAVWMGTCRNCHLLGVAGAPAVTDPDAWDQRLTKGRGALYASALGGIKDVHGAYRMPPQGGNPRLAELDVRRAVDYMLAAVEYLRASGP